MTSHTMSANTAQRSPGWRIASRKHASLAIRYGSPTNTVSMKIAKITGMAAATMPHRFEERKPIQESRR